MRQLRIVMPPHHIPRPLQLMRVLHAHVPQRVEPGREHRRRRHALQVLQPLHAGRDVLEPRRRAARQVVVREGEDAVALEVPGPCCCSPSPAGRVERGPGAPPRYSSTLRREVPPLPSVSPAERDRRRHVPPPRGVAAAADEFGSHAAGTSARGCLQPVDEGGVLVELGRVAVFGGEAVVDCVDLGFSALF